jgi:hypothetical protein
MSDYLIYLLIILFSIFVIGIVIVGSRFARDIKAARERVENLGSQMIVPDGGHLLFGHAEYVVLPGQQQIFRHPVGNDGHRSISCKFVQKSGMVVMVMGEEQIFDRLDLHPSFLQSFAVGKVIPIIASINLEIATLARNQVNGSHS